jgi:hypothetical protein
MGRVKGFIGHLHSLTCQVKGFIGRVKGFTGHVKGFIGRMKGFIGHLHSLTCHMKGFIGHLHSLTCQMKGFIGGVKGFIGHVKGFIGRMKGFIGRVKGFIGRVKGFTGRVKGFTGHVTACRGQPEENTAYNSIIHKSKVKQLKQTKMKKIKMITGLSYRQLEGMKRNGHAMSKKTQKRYACIILLAVTVPTIKGKLGFNVRTPDGRFIAKAKAIHDALLADLGGFYTPAFALLGLILTQITAMETEMNNLLLGVPGSEGAKTAAKKALKITLDSALNYINNIAFLNQADAVAIITGCTMMVIGRQELNKQDFYVLQGKGTGEVRLFSLAVKVNNKRVRASYQWQYSIDNGATWVSLDSTVGAKTVAVGMATDVKTLFRKRTVSAKGGTSAWCSPVAITPV